jgi:hypothetical protein
MELLRESGVGELEKEKVDEAYVASSAFLVCTYFTNLQ